MKLFKDLLMNIYRVLVKLSEGLESAKVRYRIHCMRVFGKPNYKKNQNSTINITWVKHKNVVKALVAVTNFCG